MELDNEEDNPITGVIDNNENEFIGSDVVGFVSTTNVYDYNNYALIRLLRSHLLLRCRSGRLRAEVHWTS